jgi:hypothetical protein
MVSCGNTPCAAGEACCYDPVNQQQVGCAPARTCGGGLVELACDGPSDCPGAICCGSWIGATWTEMSCQPTCSDPSDRILCGGDASQCVASGCTESGAAPGYHWCT